MDQTGIWNLALNSAGGRATVSDPAERSREADVCRLWWDTVRDAVLGSAYWPNTRATAQLAPLVDRDYDSSWAVGDPEPEYRYAYQVPSDCLVPRYLASYNSFVFTILNGNVRVIQTNETSPVLIYTSRVDIPALWDSQLVLAVAYALAAHIAKPLTGKAQQGVSAMQMANQMIQDARVTAANSDQQQYETIPDWISARGYGGGVTNARYIYPLGPMISVAGLR